MNCIRIRYPPAQASQQSLKFGQGSGGCGLLRGTLTIVAFVREFRTDGDGSTARSGASPHLLQGLDTRP